MQKPCVVLGGKVINIGDWDYMIRKIEVSSEVRDEEGSIITPAVYEDHATNPLPEGATIENRDVEYDEERGWYVVGVFKAPTIEERLQSTEDALTALLGL